MLFLHSRKPNSERVIGIEAELYIAGFGDQEKEKAWGEVSSLEHETVPLLFPI